MSSEAVSQASELATHGLTPSGRRPGIPGGPQTVAEVLDRALAQGPEREALVGRHACYRYRELDQAANRAAHVLAGLGIGSGDRLAASLPNHTDIVIAFLGAMRLGAIWVGIHRALPPAEKEYVLADSEAAVFLGDGEMVAQIEGLRGELPALRHLLRADPGDAASPWTRRLAAATAAGRPRLGLDPHAPAAIAYSSGPSGLPKGAVHSQHNLILPGVVAAAVSADGPELRQGVLMPLTALNLMVLAPLVAFQVGGCCVVLDSMKPLGIAEWVRTEGVGHFIAPPRVHQELLTHPDVKPQDLATLTLPEVGGAPSPESLRQLYRERFGCEVAVAYLLSEAPATLARSDLDERELRDRGARALPHVSIQIVDEQERGLPPGQVGEVCVAPATKGPFAGLYTPFLGYWNQPAASATALRGGLLHTVDLGTLGSTGLLRLKGRQSERILRGGARVYPTEIECVLHEDPRVAACAVVGQPAPRVGTRIVAFVQLLPGAAVRSEELEDLCARRLAHYQIPDEFRFVGIFPYDAMGRIRKAELLRRLAS